MDTTKVNGTTGKIPEITYGESDETWKEYNLSVHPILSNGDETVYRSIIRKDKMVAVVKGNYTLLPNEKALEAGLEAARLTGMSPFFIKKGSNFLLNARETKLYAMFIPSANIVHQVAGDQVQIGVTVSNSIDGSASFGCGLFSFRSVCSNGVIIGKKNIETMYKAHTKSLEPMIKDLQSVILQMMEKGTIVLENYQRMAEEAITQELVDKLRKSRIPKNILPEYVTTDEIVPDLLKLTEWQLYNDLTEAIWHSDRTGIDTKEVQFQYLHNIMPVVNRA